MAAPIIKVSKRINATEKDTSHGKLLGIGSTLEGFGVNRFMFEWLFDYPWDKDVINIDKWITKYAQNNDLSILYTFEQFYLHLSAATKTFPQSLLSVLQSESQRINFLDLR